jgi:spermidine/putrescine ABC transporter ATP-binding subunit
MSLVKLENTVKEFGNFTAVESLNLEIPEGKFLTLLGPSGCGKTTTLRMLAGFIDPTAGRILIDGEDITKLPPHKRQIGMVFQDYALFPHMTIADNIAFGLKEHKVKQSDIKRRLAELLELVKLIGLESRYPSELSGGQQQRVALARAIAYPPRVLLMDEPLGALDLKLREAMQIEIRRIQQELRITTIYVTHDQSEAMSMSDYIAVMNKGRLEQVGNPTDIYNQPSTQFVANFLGRSNFITGTIIGHRNHQSILETSIGQFDIPRYAGDTNRTVSIAIRPENLKIYHSISEAAVINSVAGKIETMTFTGNLTSIRATVGDKLVLTIEIRPKDVSLQIGQDVVIAWRPENSVVLCE